jgi:hypothetical protein
LNVEIETNNKQQKVTMVTPEKQAFSIMLRLFKDPSYYFKPCGSNATTTTWVVEDVTTGGDTVVTVDASPKAKKTRQMMKAMVLALLLDVLGCRLNPSAKRTLLVNILKERERPEEAQYDFIGFVRGVLNGTIVKEGDIERLIGVH